MNCTETSRWIDASIDGELDPKNDAEVREHLESCAACKQRYEAKRALSTNMRRLDLGYSAPASLRARIAAALEAEMAAGEPTVAVAGVPTVATVTPAVQTTNVVPLNARAQRETRRGAGRWFALAGWPVALAASAMLATVMLQQREQVADDIVSAHVRSLLVDHLNDVVSSSHHTVKPWFAGKIDFAPPVPDLSAQGFELVGGRLDYLEHRPAAALVYKKHGHIINVLVSRDAGDIPRTAHVQGYTLHSWKQGGLTFVAVSDIDPVELNNLERDFEMPAPQAPEPTGGPSS